MTSLAPASSKKNLRRQALARRDGLDAAYRTEASGRIARHALALPELKTAPLLGCYWPIRSEVDPRGLMAELVARGQQVALSQVIDPDLSFHVWLPDETLVPGPFGLSQPHPDAPAVFPTILLMPLAAFDRRGGRIGYGRGYFDRTVAALQAKGPVLTVGLAFAAQEVDEVPLEAHDHLLDIVITDSGPITTRTLSV